MAETAVDFLLESLNQIRKGETYCLFSAVEMNGMGCLYAEIESLRICLEDLEKYHTDEHEEIVKDVLTEIRDVAYEAADIIDLSLFNRISIRRLGDVLIEIISIKKEMMMSYERKFYFIATMHERQRHDGIQRERGRALAAVDSLLEKLNQLLKDLEIDSSFSIAEMNQIPRLYDELQYLGTTCSKDLEKKQANHRHFQKRFSQISGKAIEAENIIQFSLRNTLLYPHRTLTDVLKEIKSIRKQVTQIYQKKLHCLGDPQLGPSFHGSSSNVEEETVVGFDHEVEMLKEQLTGIQNQLQVVSIVGMAGLGKTTLARKLYNDPYILYHFYIRAWTYVSQEYRKRDLLLRILSSVLEHRDQISTESDEKLGEELYKRLKGKRYLVVMDDMWHIGAWNDLKRYFPNDNNGSKILFTSRHTDVALHAKHDSSPHYLRFLNQDESWELLQKKIFRTENCPPDLMDIGKQIAKRCQGLPLAIVVVAGLLAKTDKIQDWWKQVAENLSSYVISNTEQCMDILALSYNYLPYHLKSCFLYFGTFPEDCEISVQKLIWLWIAEGFIHRIGLERKNMELVAEHYLMDLIDRNLVLVTKRKSTGGIRACRVHDLLHDLCLRKADEDKFLLQIYGNQHRRLCVNSHISCYIPSKPFVPHIRSFLCFISEQSSLPPKNMSFIYGAFKLLRVLDLLAISIPYFPSEAVDLFLLRYLALQGKHLSIPASISNLQNLEILIISQGQISDIPNELWNIATLRHLRIAGENYIDGTPTKVGSPMVLVNLQTISHLCPTRSCQRLLVRTPNLRKLGFCGRFDSFWFPDLDFLNHLETLKLLNRYVPNYHRYNLQGIKFAPNLKSLTLSNTAFEWKEMSVLGMLPNLEVLKLEFRACIGSLWETSDGGFRRLKCLRLYYMDVEQWNASSIHFPSLRHLVVHRCPKLKEIPTEIGDICTLQTIEVNCCSDSAINSARKIQRKQEDNGNDSLKIIIINLLS